MDVAGDFLHSFCARVSFSDTRCKEQSVCQTNEADDRDQIN